MGLLLAHAEPHFGSTLLVAAAHAHPIRRWSHAGLPTCLTAYRHVILSWWSFPASIQLWIIVMYE